MRLITDSGSTKCDWVLLDNSGKVLLKTKTKGLNPVTISGEEIQSRISANPELNKISQQVEILNFYGAGCGTSIPRNNLRKILSAIFSNAKINVQEDLVAAVYAVTEKPGIVCILGTGSNSCYFDGTEIHSPIPSLGYTLMDEASGNYYGKKLLQDYYYQRMPSEIASEFQQKFNLEPDDVKTNLYKKANPTAYLASFAKFIFSKDETTPYFDHLIREGIENFIECRILSFKASAHVPIHFIGSIAYFSKDIIHESLMIHGLNVGNIVKRPIDGLIEYHKGKISNS